MAQPKVALKGTDEAGGVAIAGSPDFFSDGKAVVRVGDRIQAHGSDGPHDGSPTMVEGSSTFFVNGKAVCRAGDDANCGHSISGSGTMRIG